MHRLTEQARTQPPFHRSEQLDKIEKAETKLGSLLLHKHYPRGATQCGAINLEQRSVLGRRIAIARTPEIL